MRMFFQSAHRHVHDASLHTLSQCKCSCAFCTGAGTALNRHACPCRQQSMVTFNSMLKPHMSEANVLAIMSQSSEFESMMVR